MRSAFNEAQSDDTLRQVGGVFYTDCYCTLVFTYLLRSAALDDRAQHPTRPHRTRFPFHLNSRLNFRSTHPRTDNCFPMNTRTSSCASSTRSVEASCILINVFAKFIASLRPIYILRQSNITLNHESFSKKTLANQRKKSILREMLSAYLDRSLNWFRDLRTTPPDRRALTLISRHPSAFLLSITRLRFLPLRGLLSEWISLNEI